MAVPSGRGRELFEQRAWADAYAELSRADDRSRLTEVPDLERLAISAHLVGRPDDAVAAWERAHQAAVDAGDAPGAARSAFWLAFVLLNRGELARGGGWVQRARGALSGAGREGAGSDGVEQGYLAYGAALRSVLQGELDEAITAFGDATRAGEQAGDHELTALARVGLGRCLIRKGDAELGMAMLDEAMVMVTVDEIGPTAVGDLYCTAIEGCQELYDVRRAQEWTEALHRWCASQPQLVLYRGQCLVHRAELMLLGGHWSEALVEVQRACDRLSRPRSQAALGSAHYVRAELHRLQGRLAEAEVSYRQASGYGHEPQPGMALLWLAQGRGADAEAALRRVLQETGPVPGPRARLLGPYVEIALALDDLTSARESADELATIAARLGSPYVDAMAAHAAGALLLAEGDPGAALRSIRRARTGWAELGAPLESARAQSLIGYACRALGDERTARQELDAARAELVRLGAVPDAGGTDRSGHEARPGGLTPREVEVLAELAAGKSNRAIAAALFISEKTVATHVSSILRKLQLPSRGAANSYAHEHGLVPRGDP